MGYRNQFYGQCIYNDQTLYTMNSKSQSARYKIGFILTTQLGNLVRYENLKKYVERDMGVDCIWAPIDYKPDSSKLLKYARLLPGALYWRFLVLYQSYPVLKRIGELDAIMIHQFEPSLLLSAICRFRRRPIIVNSTDDTPLVLGADHPTYANEMKRSGLMQALRLKLDLWRVRRADISVPMSAWAANILVAYCEVPANKVFPVHVGLDLELWPPLSPRPRKIAGRRNILFVGGDFERKGGSLLLRVHQAYFSDSVQLHLVTKHSIASSCINVLVYDDISPRDDRLRQLYADCDIFVLPTNSDLVPWVCLEASASCRPVIATRVGGIPEIVVDGETGILVEKGDEVGLARAIATLLADPAKCEAMGKKGRALVEREFNAEVNVKNIVGLMKAAANGQFNS